MANSLQLSLLQFANDTILLGKGTWDNLCVLGLFLGDGFGVEGEFSQEQVNWG